jgi:uncharacterized protein (TIGR04255 family)
MIELTTMRSSSRVEQTGPIPSPMARRTYLHPPIEEALVELRFAAESDVTVAGRLHERLHNRYPGSPEEQQLVTAGIAADQNEPTTGSVVFGEQGRRVLLRDDEGRRLLGVGPQVLSIHNLRPYGGWEEDFRPRVVEALEAFGNLVSDSMVTKLGLRYINLITVPVDRLDVDEYFATGYMQPDSVAPAVNRFFVRLESELRDDVRLATTFASTDAPEGNCAFLLDLDLICDRAGAPLALSEAMPLIDELRQIEREAFEAMIKDPLRRLFDV